MTAFAAILTIPVYICGLCDKNLPREFLVFFDAGESKEEQGEVVASAMKEVALLVDGHDLISDESSSYEHGVRREVSRSDGMMIALDIRRETELPFNGEKDNAAVSLFVGVPNMRQ